MSDARREPVDIPGTPRYQPPEGSEGRRVLDAAVLAYTKGYNADVLAPYDQRHRLGVYAALRAGEPPPEGTEEQRAAALYYRENGVRNPMSSLEHAIEIAAIAHAEGIDKGGEPYILHVLRVMLACPVGDAQIAAVLHDVVEDTGVTLDYLGDQGFSPTVLEAVDVLTHSKYEPYADYIGRCSRNDIARVVKIADLQDNLIRSRIPNPTDRDHKRWAKYENALVVLRGPQPEEGE